MRRVLRLVAGVGATFGLASVLFAAPVSFRAQVTGSMSGLIKGPVPAAIPNSKVTAASITQNSSSNVAPNAQAFYQFTSLQPQLYAIEVEKTGFGRLTQTGVTLNVNQPLRGLGG